MELKNLFPIAVDLPITMPDGQPTGVTLKVVGQDSKSFRAAAKRVASEMIGREDKPSVDQMERQGAEMVAACIVGWTGLTSDGQPLEYSEAKALELMSMPELTFMRNQVEGFVSQRTNFFHKST